MFNDNNKTRKSDAYLRPHQPSAMKLLVKNKHKNVNCQLFSQENISEPLRFPSECGKIQTRITPNTDTFQTVFLTKFRQSDQRLSRNILNLLLKT